MRDSFGSLLDQALDDRADAALLRQRVVVDHIDAAHVRGLDGRTLVNFSSNNYLGLTHHPRMVAALHAISQSGAGAAGLITGHTTIHADAERVIASWKQTEAALLMPSGYQANVAVVQTIAAMAASTGRAVRFLVDKLAHASLIDAVRQHEIKYRVFPHNGLDKLARLLDDAPPDELQVVLTESVFSMDGDAADLVGLAALKARRDFVLVVDEAHGSGVYGIHGAGLVNALGLRGAVDVSVVTLSKALGVSGGAVCGSAKFVSAVENFGRAFIYSTAVSPVIARLTQEAIGICRDEPQLQQRARSNARRVRKALGVASSLADSPIIPVILGDAQRALDAAAKLREQGLLIVAIRPPTVPPGTSRLRITVSAAHSDAELDELIDAVKTRIA